MLLAIFGVILVLSLIIATFTATIIVIHALNYLYECFNMFCWNAMLGCEIRKCMKKNEKY